MPTWITPCRNGSAINSKKINQQQNLQLSQQRLVLARSQYQAGAVSFQSLLDAEDDLLTIETNLSDLQYNYLNATMKLWLALGGGVEKDSDITG
ncbi:copper/silver efflux system outer membrane protein CusC [Serratia fonticola]|uniref:Copper/silver efflux system outer membrane protein CusC n=1 Tax=Serratia fonticola TaxID=47917 RepID=A0A4U9UI06_SERFO|nr:copper/silver efflux system outer membrane protein CusC [Serratia fonticola]